MFHNIINFDQKHYFYYVFFFSLYAFKVLIIYQRRCEQNGVQFISKFQLNLKKTKFCQVEFSNKPDAIFISSWLL